MGGCSGSDAAVDRMLQWIGVCSGSDAAADGGTSGVSMSSCSFNSRNKSKAPAPWPAHSAEVMYKSPVAVRILGPQ